MTERKTHVLNELEVAQSEEWVVVDVETPVIEELEKAKAFLAVGTCWGGALQNMTLSNFLINKFCCLNKKCLDYGKKGVGNIVVHNRYGKHDEIRMLKCKTCGSYFSERTDTALYNCKLQKDKALEIIYHLSKGCSIRKIHRLTGVSRDAISRLAHIDREHGNSLLDYLIRYLKVREALFDGGQSSVEKK